jgi:adenine-specific DNA-methyltransferase
MRSLAKNEPSETETLYDKPIVEHDKIRISGPFTVEAIPVPSIEDPSLASVAPRETSMELPATVAEDHVSRMIDLVRKNGITFAGGKQMTLENVRPILSAGFLHAEAQAKRNGDVSRVSLSFGPRYGPITAQQVEEGVRSAYMMGFNDVVFAGFTFDPEALATIQKNPHPNLQVHMANICPDVEMGDLLKSAKGSQLFTVFGQPDVGIKHVGEEYIVELLGVDIYDPTKGKVHPSRPEDVAAWFLDQDYNGYTFCITQAFFPKEATNRNPWDKLENALHGSISKEKMENLRGTTSLPFRAGDQKRIAAKVIDQRGNEVIVVKKLEEAA